MRIPRFLSGNIPEAFKNGVKEVAFSLRTREPFRFPSVPIIQSAEYTLDKCKSLMNNGTPGAYCRFGDGDINLARGEYNRSQVVDPALGAEIRSLMSLRSPSVMKSLALHSDAFGIESQMRFGVHKWSDLKAKKLLYSCYEFFIGSEIYSPVALHYMIVYHPDVALSFLAYVGTHRPIFVGGDHNNPEIIARVLGASDFVLTPPTNAYASIDSIEDDLVARLGEREGRFSVVVMACGATGKALTLRILNAFNNVFVLDLGSVIELFHGREKWSWVRLSGRNREYWDGFALNIAAERQRLVSRSVE